MKIVTASDSNYFQFLLELIVACKDYLDILPAIYDLGLESSHKEFLKLSGMDVYHVPDHPKPGNHYPEGYFPSALHKPAMLLDFAYRTEDDILYLDADAKPVDFFEFPDVEVGATKASDKVIQSYEGTLIAEYLGPYHTSVIFMKYENRIDFLRAWETDLENDELPSDMKSFNRVAKVTELDEEIWNSTTKYPHTRIVHVQGPVVR
jgi:hypothetical protein